MFWVTFRDSPQKTHSSAWVDLLCFPRQTALHHSSSAVPSVCTNGRGLPTAPGGLLPTRILLFCSLGTMQDCTGFCPIPPWCFPRRRDLVGLISTCTICRSELSLHVSAVAADHLFLCFPFWLIINPRKSFHFILSHFLSNLSYSVVSKALWKSTLLSVCMLKSFCESAATDDRPCICWKQRDLHRLPNRSHLWMHLPVYVFFKFLPTCLAQRTNFLIRYFLMSFFKIGGRFATSHFVGAKNDTNDKFPTTRYLTVFCCILWNSHDNLLDQLNENETWVWTDIMNGSLDNIPTLSAYLIAILHPQACNYILCKRFLIIY